jgi:hypothetical protein
MRGRLMEDCMNKRLLAAPLLLGTALFAVGAHAQGIASAPVTTDSFGPGRVNNPNGTTPAPGTVTVTLRAQLWTDIGYSNDSGTVGKTAAGTTNGSKNGSFQVQEYFRLYPKLDGVAANGLQYGAFVQIRQNNGANGSTAGAAGSATNLGNSLYVRNAYSYIGLPMLGKIYAGQANGALTTFITGTLEGIDVNGGFNGDAPDFQSTGTELSWLAPDAGGTYTTNKVVYVSPKFAGFDFAASFEPFYSTGGAAQCNQAGAVVNTASNCSQLASTPGGVDRRRNTYDVAARYTGSFGPVAAIVEGGYWGSGVVNNSSGPNLYKGLDSYDAGVQVSAYGFLVGAHYDGGAINSGYQPIHTGGKKEQAFVGGAQYTVGTITGGVQLIDDISSGTFNPSTKYQPGLHETGFVLGGAWDYASGATAYASVLYGQRHQSGIDLLNGVPGAYNNSTTARVFAIGNVFRW